MGFRTKKSKQVKHTVADANHALAATLEQAVVALRKTPDPVEVALPVTLPWNALIWVVDPETRLNVKEAAQALGRPVSFLYRHTSQNGTGEAIPCTREFGRLTFTAAGLREWMRSR